MEDGTETRMEQGFSERLKRYRKEKNLTQQQLADALGGAKTIGSPRGIPIRSCGKPSGW